MSGGSAPTPPSPTQSAQAEASAQLAGQMFQAENAPVLGYEDALTRGLYQPYETQLLSATSANSAMQQAQANEAIQYATNPQQYEGQQMAMAGANARVANLYGVNPSDYSFKAPAAFQMPSSSMLPNLNDVTAMDQAIASRLGSVNIGSGGQVTLLPPGGIPTNPPRP